MMSLFGFLDGASPWLWLTIALAMGAIELVATSFFLIWMAPAALAVAGALLVAPGLSGAAQAVLFGALSVGFTFGGRAWLRRRRAAGGETRPALNRRAASLTGRRATVTDGFDTGVGGVEIDGLRWRARLADEAAAGPAPGPGDMVAIRGADGAVLMVTPV